MTVDMINNLYESKQKIGCYQQTRQKDTFTAHQRTQADHPASYARAQALGGVSHAHDAVWCGTQPASDGIPPLSGQ
jgi:hypothetical protein